MHRGKDVFYTQYKQSLIRIKRIFTCPGIFLCVLSFVSVLCAKTCTSQCPHEHLLLFADGEHKEAVRHFERSVEAKPEDSWGHVSLAAARLAGGEVDGSLASLKRAVDLDPSSRFRIRNMRDFEALSGNDTYENLVAAKDA